jgi:xanthine dehydrogenase accessory factor
VLATVVRSLKPASAKTGDRALILADQGTLGWVGGGCVTSAVEREAMHALADGAPRLVRLSPEHLVEDGIVSYPMTCHSGGTLDIYLEPVLPPPELVILGDSPVAEALTELAAPLGFRIRNSLEAITTTADAWVVTAAMSSGEDHPAVRAALERGVGYVAMVASRRRTEAFLSELRADGLSEEVLARLKAPAGLDIGAATGAEIALSILAEIVQRRRSRPLPSPVEQPELAIDPICGMTVDPATANWSAEQDGETYYFCAPGCRKAFLASV